MPRAIRKIASEYKILDKCPAYGSSTSSDQFLIEQAPTKKLYRYCSKEYYIPQPWTYYVIQSTLVHSQYMSNYRVVSIFASKEQIVDYSCQVMPPVLSNMLGSGHVPCAQSMAFKAPSKRPQDKDIVHDMYSYFWGQRGNSEGYEYLNTTFKKLSEVSGISSRARARLFNWLSTKSVSDILAIDFPTKPLYMAWEVESIVKHFAYFKEVANAA